MQSGTKYYPVVMFMMLLVIVGQAVGPLALTASAGTVRNDDDEHMPTGKGWGERAEPGRHAPTPAVGTTSNGISYHGGASHPGYHQRLLHLVWQLGWQFGDDHLNGLGEYHWRVALLQHQYDLLQ